MGTFAALVALTWGTPQLIREPPLEPLPRTQRLKPGSPNGWEDLRAALSEIAPLPGTVDWKEWARLPEQDRIALREWVDRHRSTAELLDRAAAKPRIVLPSTTMFATDDDHELWRRLGWIARLKALQGLLYAESGRMERSIDSFLTVVKLGNQVADGGGCLWGYLVGTAVSTTGLRGLRIALSLGPPPARWTAAQRSAWSRVIPRLVTMTPSPDVVQRALGDEAAAASEWIRKPDLMQSAAPRSWWIRKLVRTSSVLYDIDQSVWLLNRAAAMVVSAAPVARSERNLSEFRSWIHPRGFSRLYNPVGKVMVSLTAEPWLGALDTFDRATASFRATTSMVALMLFESEAGNLPPNWKRVVEAGWLPRVPEDPFDGQPLRYRPDRRIVYSVGHNGRDDGGEAKPGASGKEADMVFVIP